jgi:hypothetical protein
MKDFSQAKSKEGRRKRKRRDFKQAVTDKEAFMPEDVSPPLQPSLPFLPSCTHKHGQCTSLHIQFHALLFFQLTD